MKSYYRIDIRKEQDGKDKYIVDIMERDDGYNLIGFCESVQKHYMIIGAEVYAVTRMKSKAYAYETMEKINATFKEQGRLLDFVRAYDDTLAGREEA